MTIHRSQVETAMHVLGYLHGRQADQDQRARDFRKIVKGQNCMTPALGGFYRLKAKPYVIVEISIGEFMGAPMIGATVVDCAAGESLHDESTSMRSLDELRGFFDKLERKFA